MSEIQKIVIRPEATEEALAWAASAPTDAGRLFRQEVMVHNMVSRSHIGRSAFVIEIEGDTERLAIQPPLTAGELSILSRVPYFRGVLQEVINV